MSKVSSGRLFKLPLAENVCPPGWHLFGPDCVSRGNFKEHDETHCPLGQIVTSNTIGPFLVDVELISSFDKAWGEKKGEQCKDVGNADVACDQKRFAVCARRACGEEFPMAFGGGNCAKLMTGTTTPATGQDLAEACAAELATPTIMRMKKGEGRTMAT